MRKKLALALFASLVILAAPALSTAIPAAIAPSTTASPDLAVDDFLLAGIVTTELVTAVRCPIEVTICTQAEAGCGITPGICHCKAGGINGSILVCVKNPGGDGGPVE
jgi:hypothetical protein